jgi:hypothetical protein
MNIGITLDFGSIMSTMTYNSANHRAFSICLLGHAEDGRRLVRRLERNPSFASNPLFAPVIMASLVVHDLRLVASETYIDCSEIESKLGYWTNDFEKSVEEELDFTRMPQSLNKIAIRTVNDEQWGSSMTSSLSCLGEQLQVWGSKLCPGVGVELQEQVRYLQQCTASCAALSQRTKDGVQFMIQTVRLCINACKAWIMSHSNRCTQPSSKRTINSTIATVPICDLLPP